MKTKTAPCVEVQMMIRKPIADVFNAFIDPEITTKFWLTKSSGPLAVGESVLWEWEMYQVSTIVHTHRIVPYSLILMEWGQLRSILQIWATKNQHSHPRYICMDTV